MIPAMLRCALTPRSILLRQQRRGFPGDARGRED